MIDILVLMNVVVDGLMTSYRKSGSGKPVVFLHGWGDNQDSFDNLQIFLADNYQLLSLDLPGFGGSQKPEIAWGLNDYAAFVSKWLAKIGQKNVYAVVGHSFGGAVSIVLANQNKTSLDKIVLIASAGIRGERTAKKRLLWLAAKAAKVPLYILPANKAKKLKVRLYKKAGSDILLVPHMRETFKRIVNEDVRPAAKSIKQPTLLLYGTADKETPIAQGQLLKDSIRSSQIEVIEGAGHFLHQEEAESVAQKIKNFLG